MDRYKINGLSKIKRREVERRWFNKILEIIMIKTGVSKKRREMILRSKLPKDDLLALDLNEIYLTETGDKEREITFPKHEFRIWRAMFLERNVRLVGRE